MTTPLQALLQAETYTVFLNGDFQETVSYTPFGGSPKTINAVIDRNETLDTHADSDGSFTYKRYTIHISTDATLGIATVGNKDQVVVDGITFSVDSIPFKDGFGMQEINLISINTYEKGSQTYRIPR